MLLEGKMKEKYLKTLRTLGTVINCALERGWRCSWFYDGKIFNWLFTFWMIRVNFNSKNSLFFQNKINHDQTYIYFQCLCNKPNSLKLPFSETVHIWLLFLPKVCQFPFYSLYAGNTINFNFICFNHTHYSF